MSEPRLIIPPSCEPVSLDDAKRQLRIVPQNTEDDALIRSCISAARMQAQNITRRQLVMATLRLTLDGFPGGEGSGSLIAPRALPNSHLDDPAILLYGGPVQQVLSVKYWDSLGVLQTLDPAAYSVDLENNPARLMPAAGQSWPSTLAQIGAVVVNFSAGDMIPFTGSASADTITLAAGARAMEEGQAFQVRAINGQLPSPLQADTNYFAKSVSGLTCQLAASAGGSALDIAEDRAGTFLIDNLAEDIRHAIRMLVSFFYDNRGEENAEMPAAVGLLLSSHKAWRF